MSVLTVPTHARTTAGVSVGEGLAYWKVVSFGCLPVADGERRTATITAMNTGARGRRWAVVEVVVAVVCALGAAGLLWWLGWSSSWSLGVLASRGAAKAAVLGVAGLAGGLLWLRQRRNRSEDSQE
ncbi:hypothetical protein M2169_005828 [Streptomyces sp. MJP52]|nr:hypothetical protein [Streptomyces sp. MJP52]